LAWTEILQRLLLVFSGFFLVFADFSDVGLVPASATACMKAAAPLLLRSVFGWLLIVRLLAPGLLF